jgi:serine/threonine protein kinase
VYKEHFVWFEGAFRKAPKNRNKSAEFCIVLTLCDMTLKDFLLDNQNLTLRQKYELCLHIAEGVQIMHSHNLIHRDLNPANILMVARDGQSVPLIADFGHSKVMNEFGMTIMRGTPQFTNPFIAESTTYGIEWDLYSLGIIFFQIFQKGSFLFDTMSLRSHEDFHHRMKDYLSSEK